MTIPAGAAPDVADVRLAAEAIAARKFAAEGKLVRLWRLSDGRALGLWQTGTDNEIQAIVDALPLAGWLQTETVPSPSTPATQPTPPQPPDRWTDLTA